MIFDRCENIGDGIARIGSCEHLTERADNASVSAAVTARDLLVPNRIGDHDLFGLSGKKIEHCHVVVRHFGVNLTLGSHDAHLASALGESTHGKGHRSTRRIFQIDDLMIDHVVVTLEHALAVIDLGNGTLDMDDIHNLADSPLVDDLFEQTEKRRKAQHMANDDPHALFVGGNGDIVALLGRGAAGFSKSSS